MSQQHQAGHSLQQNTHQDPFPDVDEAKKKSNKNIGRCHHAGVFKTARKARKNRFFSVLLSVWNA